ncbi:MAG: hypothetical protein AAF420_12550, partial [Pseudomonadota bacterium]
MTSTADLQVAQQWLRDFESAIVGNDPSSAAQLFNDDGHWRDLVSFTWNIKTASGLNDIAAMLGATAKQTQARSFTLEQHSLYDEHTLQVWFRFGTAVGLGWGIARLRNGRCWTLLTTLQSLRGFEQRCGQNRNREAGTEHGAHRGKVSWGEAHTCLSSASLSAVNVVSS